ncbi:MAG: hypothetical protein IPJ28_07445 [Betaproteobacteria bacterium]|nr:hypothetical protein [Betaproteobacteria bacterium]
MLTQASGISIIHETVYERRFDFLTSLSALGAKTQIETHCLGLGALSFPGRDFPHSAIVRGPELRLGRHHARRAGPGPASPT